jgi:hypothetical protein
MRLALVLLVACQVPMHAEMGPKGHKSPARYAGLPRPDPRAAAQPAPDERGGTIGIAMRVGGMVEKHLLLGGEAEYGAGRSTSDAANTVETSTALGLGAVVGLKGRFGRLSPSFELAAGMRSIERQPFHQRSTYVERRLRLDVWVFDRFSIGLYGGFDLDGNWVIGIRETYHLEPYDGD